MNDGIDKVAASIKNILKPNGRVDLIKFLKKEAHVVNSQKSSFIDFNLTPWWKEPFLELMENPTLKEMNLLAPIGSGKTTFFLAVLYVSLLLKARQTLIVGISEQLTIDTLDLFIKPSLKKNKKIKAIWPQRKDDRKESIHFAHMSIFTGFATSVRTLQQRSCDMVINDECWKYDDLILDYSRGRLHDRSGSRMLNVSQGGLTESPWEQTYNKGLIKQYSWGCPCCNEYNIYNFDDLKFDYLKTDDDKPIYKTVKAEMECPRCNHRVADTIENRRSLSEGGKYIVENEEQNYIPKHYSYTINQLCVYDVPWENIARDFLMANNSMNKATALMNFFQQKMGRHWDNSLVNTDYNIEDIEDGYLMDEFKNDHSWKFRFMTADVQQSQLWVNIRDFDEFGNSRLVAFKYCSSLSDLEEIRKDYNVKPKCVAVDMAYKELDVKTACCIYGWLGYNGQMDRTYTWTNNGKKLVKYYSEPKTYSIKTPNGIKTCQAFHYSGPTVKDILTLSLMSSGKWKVPSGGENHDLYMSQTFGSEYRTVDKNTGRVKYQFKRANHSFDNECSMIPLATIHGAFMSDSIEEVKEN